MRILVLNWRDPAHPHAGGAEIYTDKVIAAWAASGDEITWFAGQPGDLPSHERRADGVEIIRRGGRVSVYFAAYVWWRQEGRHRDFDLIIDEINSVPFWSPLYPAHPPVLALAHQTAEEVWRAELGPVLGRVGAALEPWLLRPYRTVPTITVSSSSRLALQRLGLRHVHSLPQGTDPLVPPSDIPDTGGRPTLLWCGRLAPNKRPLDAIETLRILRRSHPAAQLWIIGDGPQRTEVDRAAASLDGVTVFGRVTTPERNGLMAAADLLLATSLREGWGLTVSEAAELGTPTVGYRVPGLVDSIPASGGLLTDPSPADLANVVDAVLSSGTLPTPRRATVPWSEVSASFRAVAERHTTSDREECQSIGTTGLADGAR